MSRRRLRRAIDELVRLYLNACRAQSGHGRVHLGADAFGPQNDEANRARYGAVQDGER
ncbi:hypothetical protein [Streptomyces clavuligerus]|uniref:hypothetical protein n=1 Tax=Streptomyces clavuligerus TaxID=1901 RepID=UPI00017FF6FC|nr:hypothetical protein [Streptomyces clavuligerus]EDY48254.1 hypothetical protein SSCG_01535 [Streptomyces clavuligerus]MBY6304210.1 hypothetical protein [Streptomyces clavuligerus]QPL64245.1 hypothetical protein I3J04_16140 [Streptomyces clavuligerus]QPL70273.1 hypothetical protein I3J05_16150 [Streptomyces clavuligerus]QPL76357.1 hypothetical protein I3J06_16155 [Streptomyces clavuligerus]